MQQYRSNQIIQQSNITQITQKQQNIQPQIIQTQNQPQTIQQEATNKIILRNVLPLPPPPPGGFEQNTHFVRNFPIYESDPRYISEK